MRLTLRTLLAYLDKTLEPDDATVLQAKINGSQFASQLSARIDAVLAHSRLAAPDPDAAGPTEDANVVGEYLDSTLPPEQIADVERACLESDVHLAEVAACHQVLTMVLGTRADVPPALRQRVYGLAAGQQSATGAGADAATAGSATAVAPVGLNDSGAYRVTTLRDAEAAVAGNGRPRRAAVGIGRRIGAAEASEIFGGNIRSSRVVPWLVSLALCAAFLFVLTRAFAPLLERERDKVAGPQQTETADRPPADVTAGDAAGPARPAPTTAAAAAAVDAAPQAEADQPTQSAPPAAADAAVPEAASSPIDAAPAPAATPPTPSADQAPLTGAQPTGDATPPVDSGVAIPPLPTQSATEQPLDSIAGIADSLADLLPAAGDGEPPTVVEVPAGDETASAATTEDAGGDGAAAGQGASPSQLLVTGDVPSTPSDSAAQPGDAPPAQTAAAADAGLATVVAEDALLLAFDPATRSWLRPMGGQALAAGTRLVCPPWSRAALMVGGPVQLTLVGPSDVVLRQVDGRPQLLVRRGQLLLSTTEESATEVALQIFGADATLALDGLETMVAISASRFRTPGADPTVPENFDAVLTVLSVQGNVRWQIGDAEPVTLETGQQWSRIGSAAADVALPSSVPTWIDRPAADVLTIEQAARDGLLELLQGDQPVDLALREAIHFRRAEVGALAARTLLLMGQPDVYFGANGVLSMPQQKSYWTDHVLALQAYLDQGPEQAAQVQRAARQMDAASADAIFRLLWGYSQQQLEAGDDATLVAMLDSPQMALRVLATETLRQITGTSLYFRPEQESAARRKGDASKWEARLRRGDIRWQQPPTPLPAAATAQDEV